jgi:hypothetical protein
MPPNHNKLLGRKNSTNHCIIEFDVERTVSLNSTDSDTLSGLCGNKCSIEGDQPLLESIFFDALETLSCGSQVSGSVVSGNDESGKELN